MKDDKVTHTVHQTILEETYVNFAEVHQGMRTHLGRVPPGHTSHKVPLGYLGLILREVLCNGLDELQDLNLMGDLVLILVHVAPQGDIHLAIHEHMIMAGPLAMAIEDHILQVRIICHQAKQSPNRW